MPLPDFEATGDLPIGVHRANLQEVLERFGAASGPRRVVTGHLVHVYELAQSTKHVQRLIIFGSYVTAKPEPNESPEEFIAAWQLKRDGSKRGIVEVVP